MKRRSDYTIRSLVPRESARPASCLHIPAPGAILSHRSGPRRDTGAPGRADVSYFPYDELVAEQRDRFLSRESVVLRTAAQFVSAVHVFDDLRLAEGGDYFAVVLAGQTH